MKKVFDSLLEIIWGTPKPKPKKKRPRDKKGRYTKRRTK